MDSSKHRPPQFELHAGILCLDFVNTLDNRPSDEPRELLTTYADLVRFAEETRVVDSRRAEELMKRADAEPAAAAHVLRLAHNLREAIYEVVWAMVKKQAVPPEALTQLNRHVRNAAEHTQLVPRSRHFEWQFEDSPSLEAVLWPIARSAADLLSSGQLQFVRACSAKTCQWLFLDTSKNHRRRWCSMQVCGNRTKVRRFYARARKQ